MKYFIPSQYNESPVFLAFIEALNKEADNILLETNRVIDLRWVDTATGANLDILGLIVGVGREVVDFIETIFFGYDPDPTAKSFGDLNDPSVGGIYRDGLLNPVQTRLLSDDEYRLLIAAKILKNQTEITPNDVLQITRYIMTAFFTDGESIQLEVVDANDGGTEARFTIRIYRDLDGSQQALIQTLDMVPRPVGVAIEYEYIPV